jgi:hypothetical protein
MQSICQDNEATRDRCSKRISYIKNCVLKRLPKLLLIIVLVHHLILLTGARVRVHWHHEWQRHNKRQQHNGRQRCHKQQPTHESGVESGGGAMKGNNANGQEAAVPENVRCMRWWTREEDDAPGDKRQQREVKQGSNTISGQEGYSEMVVQQEVEVPV